MENLDTVIVDEVVGGATCALDSYVGKVAVIGVAAVTIGVAAVAYKAVKKTRMKKELEATSETDMSTDDVDDSEETISEEQGTG